MLNKILIYNVIILLICQYIQSNKITTFNYDDIAINIPDNQTDSVTIAYNVMKFHFNKRILYKNKINHFLNQSKTLKDTRLVITYSSTYHDIIYMLLSN